MAKQNVMVYFSLKDLVSSDFTQNEFILKNRNEYDMFLTSDFITINKMYTSVCNDFPDYLVTIEDTTVSICEVCCGEELEIGPMIIFLKFEKFVCEDSCLQFHSDLVTLNLRNMEDFHRD